MSTPTTAIRTTPPYRLVLPASADRDAWLAERRNGIGSSDVAAVMGVSSYGSAQHVYYDKRGGLPLEGDAGEPALWGSLNEDTVAREWARRNRSIVRRVGLVARKDADHHRCTLDRRCDECPLDRENRERCAVEVKCRSAYVAGKWKQGMPDDVLAQVLWQIHVTGYDHIHVATLFGGNDFRQYVIRRSEHEALIANIVTVVDRLWSDIKAGQVPALTGDEPAEPMLELFGQLHPDRSGIRDLGEFPALTDAATGYLAEYETSRLTAKAAKKQQDAAKVALIDVLGKAQAALLDGEVAYELRATTRRNCDLSRLAEEFPDAYEACVTEKTSDTFAVGREYQLKELP